MLVTDADLQERMEVLDYTRSNRVKLQAYDMSYHVGSSASSNCLNP